MQRGGFPVRAVVLAFFVIGTVYLLYLYNSTVGRLRDTEVTAERYRRGEETKVAELQEAIRSKDELQEKCDNDKREFTNRLNSLNQQHKMLKSQYDEHEVEQMRLEQEARRLRDEFEQEETQRNNEYQQLRAEKELEITRLKDQIADLQRQNGKLQTETLSLQEQLKNRKKETDYYQANYQNLNTELQALKLELAKAQLQGQQKGNSLNFQPHQQEQQNLQFQKNLESLGHQQFFPDQQKIVPPGAAGGLQNGIDNMNANVGGHQEILPQRNAELQDETLGKNLEDGKQVINQSSSILMSRNDSHFSLEGEMINPLDVQVSYSKIKGLNETGYQQVTASASIIEEIDNVIQSATQSNYSAGQSTTTVPNNVTAEMHQEVLDNQHHQMLPPVHDNKEINIPDAPVNSNVDGHVEKELLKDEDHQVVPPLFHGSDKDKEADFVGKKQSEVQPLGLNPVNDLQKESGPLHHVARFKGNEEEEEDGDHAHNVLQQIPPANPPRNFGQNPPVRKIEDEEQYDKYEDDVQDDNKNGNIHINHAVENPEDDNYP